MFTFNENTSRLEYIKKGMTFTDPSHGGKLTKKFIIDRTGKKQTKWVATKIKVTTTEPKKVQPDTDKEEKHWWADFKKYNLNAYPINIDRANVEVDTSGDPDSHWIMRWKDPKTGAIKNAYSKEFLDRNAEYKWQRISGITVKQINAIKNKSSKLIISAENEADRDAAAIVNIIAHSGLRRGDRLKFEVTGNRGVSTIAPENVNIIGNRVIFNFRGKSYKENVSFVNDKVLAEYLTTLKEQRKGEKFLFTASDATIDKVFNSVGGKDLKLKDLRTYVATDLAKKVLFEDETQPPPLPPQLSVTGKKKLIKDKLNRCYEIVAKKLNNTPAMAKNAYIHPNVVTKWIELLALDFDISKSVIEKNKFDITLNEILGQFPAKSGNVKIDSNSEELCDEYNNLLKNL